MLFSKRSLASQPAALKAWLLKAGCQSRSLFGGLLLHIVKRGQGQERGIGLGQVVNRQKLVVAAGHVSIIVVGAQDGHIEGQGWSNGGWRLRPGRQGGGGCIVGKARHEEGHGGVVVVKVRCCFR